MSVLNPSKVDLVNAADSSVVEVVSIIAGRRDAAEEAFAYTAALSRRLSTVACQMRLSTQKNWRGSGCQAATQIQAFMETPNPCPMEPLPRLCSLFLVRKATRPEACGLLQASGTEAQKLRYPHAAAYHNVGL
ncbi:unnamed protein product [Taenia asiatica]|uniref:Uncharacterized protein n=1 Tax=Taenia asiatica TaxID=60517 RepID=A0A0R3VZI8_TAEAS|nr:unnamed protein product [Taenia asiatica]